MADTSLAKLAATLPHIGLREAKRIEKACSVLAPLDPATQMIREHINRMELRPQ